MRPLRVGAGLSLLGAAGLIVLVALPREAPASPALATVTAGPDPRATGVTVRADAFADPSVRGLCLLFDTGRPRATAPRTQSQGFPVARGKVRIRAGGTETIYDITLGRGECRLCLPTPGLTTGTVTGIELRWVDGDPPVLDGVAPLTVRAGEPIPADLGVVLEYRRDVWRNTRYEYYRWSLEPSILIFDTSSYETQDLLFKRLAFFVEKTGWAGTIPDYSAIADLHGFNAHDYRAEDLARFYRAAAATDTPLLAEEIELRDILLQGGVIRRAGSSYAAGEGGVLSISRGSTPELRRRLLAHEALHGLYFTSAGFRAGVERVWASSGPDLQEFFRLYLAWPDWGYNLDDPYLVVNEFLAYLLQYSEETAREQLFEAGSRWLVDRYPRRKSWIEGFRRDGGPTFLRAWRDLEAEMERAAGVSRATLIALSSSGSVTPP